MPKFLMIFFSHKNIIIVWT